MPTAFPTSGTPNRILLRSADVPAPLSQVLQQGINPLPGARQVRLVQAQPQLAEGVHRFLPLVVDQLVLHGHGDAHLSSSVVVGAVGAARVVDGAQGGEPAHGAKNGTGSRRVDSLEGQPGVPGTHDEDPQQQFENGEQQRQDA